MEVKKLIEELKENLNEQIPRRIRKIVLYGSYARNTQNGDSDIDILLIVKDEVEPELRDLIYGICYDLNSKYDVWIDVSLLSENDLETVRGKQPFVQNAMLDGIVI
ncbi:MAG: nucleotidyltransferase domain-containing protein [bacterium]